MTRSLCLLKSDDEYSGIMARRDVVELIQIAVRLHKTRPREAKQLYSIAKKVRATIPTSAWTDEAPDFQFIKVDPATHVDLVE